MPWQHMHSLLFQSTLPREERHMTVQLHPHRRRFQSTLPREERPSLYLLGAHLHNFNPRSHERSDSQQSELITMLRISIHAPTRGATEKEDRGQHCGQISIHAPTRGATVILPITSSRSWLFQSTLPREERQIYFDGSPVDITISIHAPTRGATRTVNGTPRKNIFQSTLPREERPDVRARGSEGGTISIHAPTRGATVSVGYLVDDWEISIHAPTRGATEDGIYSITLEAFQSTLPREERLNPPMPSRCLLNFNPRSHERSDTGTCSITWSSK